MPPSASWAESLGCGGDAGGSSPTGVHLRPPERHDGVLTPGPREGEPVWTQGLCGCDQVEARSFRRRVDPTLRPGTNALIRKDTEVDTDGGQPCDDRTGGMRPQARGHREALEEARKDAQPTLAPRCQASGPGPAREYISDASPPLCGDLGGQTENTTSSPARGPGFDLTSGNPTSQRGKVGPQRQQTGDTFLPYPCSLHQERRKPRGWGGEPKLPPKALHLPPDANGVPCGLCRELQGPFLTERLQQRWRSGPVSSPLCRRVD